MQPIIGTTNPGRVKESCQAANITLIRQEWYAIYRAVGSKLP
jgi:predicted oxidoreductase